jgi:hypothetical protein
MRREEASSYFIKYGACPLPKILWQSKLSKEAGLNSANVADFQCTHLTTATNMRVKNLVHRYALLLY